MDARRAATYATVRSLHLVGVAAALPLAIGFLRMEGREVLAGWRLAALIGSAFITALFVLAIDQGTYPARLGPALRTTGAMYLNYASSIWLTGKGVLFGAYAGWLVLLVTLAIVLARVARTGVVARARVREGQPVSETQRRSAGLLGLVGALAGVALVGAAGCSPPYLRALGGLAASSPLELGLAAGTFVHAVATMIRAWWDCTVFSPYRGDPELQASERAFASGWRGPTAAAYALTVLGALTFLAWPVG